MLYINVIATALGDETSQFSWTETDREVLFVGCELQSSAAKRVSFMGSSVAVTCVQLIAARAVSESCKVIDTGCSFAYLE